MAGAIRREGWDLIARVDYSRIKTANQLTDEWRANLEKTEKLLNGLKVPTSVGKEMSAVKANTAKATKQAEKLNKVLKETGSAGTYSAEKVKSKMQAVSSSTDKATKSTDELAKSYKKVTLAASKAARHSGTTAQRSAENLEKRFGSLGNKLKATMGVVTAGMGAGLVYAVKKGADAAASLQQRYTTIQNLAVTGGESVAKATKNVMAMQREGQAISIKYGKSQQEIAAGYEDLVKRGYTTGQALSALTSEVQASIASGDSLSDTYSVTSKVLEGFAMRSSNSRVMLANTKKVVNELAYTADMTSTGFSDLGYGMSYASSVAKQANISLSQTASALGILSNNGLESTRAGTGLRTVILRLQSDIANFGKTKKGKSLSVLQGLGIDKDQITKSDGSLRSLSQIMGVLQAAVEKTYPKDKTMQANVFKSLFGTDGVNAAEILAKNAREVDSLAKKVKEAGEKGNYVQKLAAKNSGTAKVQAKSAKEALEAFEMTLGNAVLPSINKASQELAKFLTSKDGIKFQKDVGGAVAKVANGLVKLIEWSSTHKTQLKLIGGAIFLGWTAVKAAKFIAFLSDVKKGYEAIRTTKTAGAISSLFGGKVAKAGPQAVIDANARGNRKWFNAPLESMRHAGGFKNLTAAGKIANVGAGVGVAVDSGMQFFNAYKDRHNADKRSQDIGQGVGSAIGGGIGLYFGGPLGALVGSQLGKFAGKWGGTAVNNFTKGWQKHKPPKKFWSMENLGWSTHNMFNQMGSGWNNFWGGLGNWRKKQAAGVGKWAHDVGKGWNNGVKGVKTWFKNIPSNIGKTGAKIKNWAGRVGTNIHNGWNKGIKASHNFFKNLPGNMSKFGKSMQRKWNATWKEINSNRYVKAFKKGTFMQTAVKDIQSRWKSFSKKFSKSWSSQWNSTKRSATKSWDATKRNASKTWGNIQSGWNSFSTKFGKKWNAGWNSFNNARYVKAFKKGEFFSTALKDIQSRWKSFSTDFGKKWNGFWGGLSKGWKNFWGGMGDWAKKRGNNLKAFGNDLDYARGGSGKAFKYTKIKSHANGGATHSTHVALVGEAGPELAYKPYASHVRLLGANGPEMTKIQAGERILNAKDTAKAMSGGIGRGTVLRGYANGTAKLTRFGLNGSKMVRDAKKLSAKLTGSGSIGSKMVRDAKKLSTTLEKNTVGSYKATRVNSTKQLKSFQKENQSAWSTIYRSTSKQTDKTHDNSVKDYTDMRKGVLKQMDNLQDGVTGSAKTTAKNFGHALNKMRTYARKAMSNTVDQLNSGINSIDKVLSQFGGNSSVIKPVHFATGTRNGKLAQDTLAVVNDAKAGPRQEAIVRSGQVYLPRGRDTLIPLKKGDEVLNGTQTQELAHSWGLPHFAKGSGVDKKRLRSIASKGAANPGKSFNQNFEKPIKSTGAKLQQGTTDLAKASTKDYGTKWMKAIWDVIESKISSGGGKGGTREAFERYAEAHYMGKPYNMGSMGPTYYDCSGMVASALQHYGINIGRTTVAMQESSGVTNLGKDISKTTRGDLVIFGHGTGANGHIGIINNSSTGTMFNETPPSARLSSISDDTSMGYSFYRIKGLHDGSSKSKKSDSRMEALAKRQLGSKALKWISKNLGESVDFSGSLNLTGDQSSRIQSLAKALKSADSSATKNGISAIVGNWLFESGLNPGIVNSIGASGLGQWLGGRLVNLKAYAKKIGRSWSNAGTQIGFALKADGSDSSTFKSILEGKGSVASLANRFSSEWERGGYNANHVAGAETVAKTLGYASGGHPAIGNTVKVGEHGPELAEFKQPVHIYSAEDTKKKEAGFTKLSKIGKGNSTSISSKPTINININGNISSESDAMKYAKLIKQELANMFSNIGDEFGLDPSFY